MRKFLALLFLAAAAAAQQSDTRVVTLEAPDNMRAEIDEIMGALQKITGLAPLRKVEYTRIGRDQVRTFLEQRVKEVVKPEELAAEEAALKKFGFVPEDFDLKKTTVDLMTEQAAAFYDYRKKKLFMIGPGGDVMQHSVLVHELAHALADQHFNLEKYSEDGKKNDDGAMARLAAMEGQATWLMSEYLTNQTGQSMKDSPVLVKLMSNASAFEGGDFPVLKRVPMYMKESLLFPYTKGMIFQHELFMKHGQKAFTEIFTNPPAGTDQILHPERYLAGEKATRPELPEVGPKSEYKEFTDGELGEFDHAIMLKQFVGDEAAKTLPPELRGAYFKLFDHKADHRLVLAYASEWASAEAARQFFADYRKVLKGKWKKMSVTEDASGMLTGSGDDGRFKVRLEGTRVTSVEGLP